MKKIDLLVEQPQDVLSVLELIKKEDYHHKDRESRFVKAEEWAIDLLNTRFNLARKDILEGNIQKIDWEIWFLRTGAIILSLLEEWIDFKGLTFAKFLLEKHSRYRLEPLLKWKEIGIVVRLDSKLARLINITKNIGLGVGDEPPEKTAEDILGYCILGYLLNRRLKNEQ